VCEPLTIDPVPLLEATAARDGSSHDVRHWHATATSAAHAGEW
jgi:hypothetical protein